MEVNQQSVFCNSITEKNNLHLLLSLPLKKSTFSVMIMCAAFRNILVYLKSWCRKPSHFRWFTRSIKMSRVPSILFLCLWSMYINILHVIFSVEDMDAYKQAVPILLPIAQIGMTGTSNKFKSFSSKNILFILQKIFSCGNVHFSSIYLLFVNRMRNRECNTSNRSQKIDVFLLTLLLLMWRYSREWKGWEK